MLSRAELVAGRLGEPDVAQKIRDARQQLAQLLVSEYGIDDIPFTTTVTRVSQTRLERPVVEPFTRADLEKVVPSQADRYIALGFHTKVYPDLAEEEARAKYRADFTLPQDAAQPAEYAGYLDVVLAVDPRIPLTKQHELAAKIKKLALDSVVGPWATSRVREWINTGNIKDLTEYPKDVPYLVFTHDGERYRPDTVTQALSLFKNFEVGNPQLEVTGLFLQEPSFFVGRGMEAAGSRAEDGGVPFLGFFRNEPYLLAHSPDSQYQDWGAASRGKDIIRLGSR